MSTASLIAQYKSQYPGTKIRGKVLEDSITEDDEASCFEALADLTVPDGIVDGLSASIDSSNNLNVSTGDWQINGLRYLKIVVSIFTLETPDASLSRYDLFYADNTNNIFKLTGTLSANPVLPALPNNAIQVCSVLIQPSGYTINQAPNGLYVNGSTNQPFIDGVKTFIRSPQVPNAINAQDAVAFNQLGTVIGNSLNNLIGPTTSGYYGIGGAPLIQDTTLNLAGFNLYINQGLQTTADFTTWYNGNDRAVVDAGYVRNSQNYKRWVSGSTVNAYNLYSVTTIGVPALYLAKGAITSESNTVSPNVAQAVSFGTDQTAAVASYNAWVAASNNFTVVNGNYLFIQNSVNLLPTGSGMATYPLFSKPIGGLERTGGDRFEFTISGDTNDGVNFVNKYVFFAGSLPSPVQTWYELPPYEKDIDIITNLTSSYQYKIHIDVARDSGNQNFEFRARMELIFNSGNPGAVQLMELEFKDASAVAFFNNRAIPSNYWKIKGTSTDPNTLLPQWLGTETLTIPELPTNTFGANLSALYSFKTRGASVIFNNTNTTNIATFQKSGTQVGYIDNNGAVYAIAINNPTSAFNASIMLNTGGVGIKRGINDAGNVLVVQNNSASFSGSLLNVADYITPALKVGQNGDNTLYVNPYTTTSSGFQTQTTIGGVIVPTANNDIEVGLDINTVFGVSKIATVDTLVGGTGYPNTATIALSVGGTGAGAAFSITVSGGVIQTAVPLRPGANYTINDVLTLQCFVGGVLTGTGGTVTVRTITTYTGIKAYAIRVAGAPILTAASTSAYGSLIIPTGVTYTGTTSGAIWQDGTHLYAYIGGAVRQLDQQTGSGGTVNSVLGVTNRTTSSGGTSPIIDISASYAGQSSITTVGTIGTGVWNGTAITDTYISSSSVWNAKMNNPMTTSGDIIIGGTSGAPTRLAKGTANQIPSINTGGTAIEYRTLSVSGGLGGGYTTGLINLYLQDAVPTVPATANLSITVTGQFYELPTISANRTITIGSASSSAGQRLMFLNQNTSTSFAWSFTGATVTDTLGNPITALSNGLLYTLESDGVNWIWMDNLSASTQYFVPGLFVGSVNPTTPTPGSIGNSFTLGNSVIGIANLSATGTASSTTFLRGDNTWATVSSPTAGNPTTSIGLTAINGSATTFMRSDAAPALNQAITPTWSAIHTWQDASASGTFNPLVQLINLTTSTGSTDLFSPSLMFRSNLYNASTNKTLDFFITAEANSSSTVGQLLISTSLAGALPTTLLSIDRFANFNISGKFSVTTAGTTTTTDGLVLNNVTAAGSGIVEKSTMLRQQGSVYNNTSSATNYVSFGREVAGISSSTPIGSLDWYGGINASSTVPLTKLMSLDTSGNLSILTGALKITAPITAGTVTGSGAVNFSQPQQGGTLKMVIINLAALNGSSSYTYPTPFVSTPVILTTNGLAASIA